MSVDSFLSYHTSEDDDSFKQIMEEQRQAFMAKVIISLTTQPSLYYQGVM